MNTRFLIGGVLLCAVPLAAGCKKGPAPAPAATSCKTSGPGNPFARCEDAVVEGRKLYHTYGCVACHGVGGGGGMGKPISDDEWKFGSDDATLFKLVRGDVPKQTMPNAIGKAMSDDEVWKTLVYVRYIYQGDKGKINWVVPPTVPPERLKGPVSNVNPVAAGRVLFMAACKDCHGETGRGDGPASKPLKIKPRNLTDTKYMATLDDRYLFEIISRGGIAVNKSPDMPQFSLSPEDLANLIAYVRTLSRTGSPHGSP